MRKLLARLARRLANRLDPPRSAPLLGGRRYLPAVLAFFDREERQ